METQQNNISPEGAEKKQTKQELNGISDLLTPLAKENFFAMYEVIRSRHEEEAKLHSHKNSEILTDKQLISSMYITAWSELKKLIFNPRYRDSILDFSKEDFDSLLSVDFYHATQKLHLFISLKILWQYTLSLQGDNIPLGKRCYDTDAVRKLDYIDNEAWESDLGGYTPHFRWIVNIMPFDLYRKYLTSPEITEAKKLTENIDEARSKLKKEVDTIIATSKKSIDDLSKVRSEATDLAARLTDVKREGNFKLLAKAFSTLRIAKREEVKYAQYRMWVFIVLLTVLPAISFLYFQFNEIKSISLSLVKYLPIVSLEILFFYFMRLFYIEVKSLKSQLVQIDLRLNLCEFIYDYIETRDKTHSDKVSDSWKAFESLIFSPIQPNEDKIPSVMDGTDVLADLAGKILKGKG
ncbi:MULTISPECIES: hypothetical protein [Citrobacter]|uniref:hypothetical protein n=1 Tax=Citrobacter TaxID=544 RepID=UPI00227A4237|nr:MULTISPECIES: hypothetical protein [Citrobacter]MDM3310623.1 hypothetical protein [Citrobacter sp. Cb223]MDM3433836.1 hypothetical protein [Citrobacter sp. Cb034]MDT7058239.1 hypothetical protein [Citrobacter braakii]MEB0954613.1 hypothetical protein [Citrobacter braakii]MEB0984437.1 hypothetical protein [Citrobacter braakii]